MTARALPVPGETVTVHHLRGTETAEVVAVQHARPGERQTITVRFADRTIASTSDYGLGDWRMA